MNNITKVIITTSLFLTAISNSYGKSNPLFTLENLERERAAFIENLTTSQLSTHQREEQNKYIIKRLIDMERMVLRDDRIAMSNSVMAKNAFQHYELTFLVHAGSESKKSPMAHWLHALNITDEKLYQSKSGAR